jgi:uncharacterized protein
LANLSISNAKLSAVASEQLASICCDYLKKVNENMESSCKRTDRTVVTREKLKKSVLGLTVAATCCLAGCAGTTTFATYPAKINPLIRNLQLKQPVDFNQCLLNECESKDSILYAMERGRVAQILGNVDVSMRDFAASMEKIKENEEKARISLSGVGATMAATAVNDNAIPYAGYGYERVMLHHYQALNYLRKKDLEGAGVEVRRANAEQEEALKRHEEEVEEAEKNAEEKKIENPSNNRQIVTAYAQMDEVAGKVKNSFQNAYTFYLSGFIYETLQQPNDAYIDYKKALEIYPDNVYLQKDVVRLAQALNMNEDLDAFKARFNIDSAAVPSDSGDLLVLFENGFTPQKQEVKILLPVPKVGLLTVAFPIYKEKWTPRNSLSIEKSGEELGLTEPICDFRALSVKALKEEIPVIATRQLMRLVARGAATKAAKDKLGFMGELAMNAYNIVSENADLRSWLTLPANAQVLRTALPAGNHRLTLKQNGQPATSVDVSIPEGGRTVLHVVRTGPQLYTSVITFPAGKTAQVVTGVQENL